MMDEKLVLMENYVRHLVTINRDRTVLVTEDVLATSRRVILSQGARVDDSAASRLRGVNLLQPISHCVYVDGSFNGQKLYLAFIDYFSRDAVLHEIFNVVDDGATLRAFCDSCARQKVVSQYLWVMQLRAPQAFERALFCAWFILSLFKRQGKTEQQLLEGFQAGLLHDVGLLFLNPRVLTESSASDPKIWQEVSSHPQVGFEILLYLSDIPGPVSRAVLEHHEDLDGAGYPHQKVGKQLGAAGRYLHLLDSIHAIYHKYFKPRARTLHDLIPIVQMNHLSKPGQPAADLIVLLREGTASESCSVPETLMPLLIDQVRERHNYIKEFVSQADVFLEQNQMAIANARFFSLQNLLQHITVAMKQSGLINDGYIRWLDQVQQERLAHAYREVEDAFLMMQEVLYHIRRFVLLMAEFVDEHDRERTRLTPIWAPEKTIRLVPGSQPPVHSRESVRQSLASFSHHKEPELPAALNELWLTQVRQLKRR